jgi:hypothetical protein
MSAFTRSSPTSVTIDHVPDPIPPLYQPPAFPTPPADLGLLDGGNFSPPVESGLLPSIGDLSLPTDDEFRGRAATNPLTEAQKLTAGNPAEITALGEDFLQAGGDMDAAHRLSQQAQQWIGDSYLHDGTPVYDQAAHIASLPKNFPDAAGQMNRVGTRLGQIAEALHTATGDAVRRYNEVFATNLPAARDRWKTRVEGVTAQYPSGLIPFDVYSGLVGERNQLAGSLQQDVTELGNTIRGLVTGYEGELASGASMLADIGYFAPEGLDAGPGDDHLTAAGAAEADARAVQDAMGRAPGQQGLDALDKGLETFAGIQERLENGRPLTADERDYATGFAQTLGEDGLTRLTRYAHDSARAATPATVAPDRWDDLVKTRYEGTLAPLGTTFAAMAEPTQPGAPASAANLPPAVQGLLDTRLGFDGGRGTRYPNDAALEPAVAGGARENKILAKLDGADRLQAASDLFAASTVAPNEALAKDLAGTAVRMKQDLNSVQDATSWTLSWPGGASTPDAATLGRLDALVDDHTAGELLSTAARDGDSAAAILRDDHLRAPVLGLNWETGAQGAADVVAHGTNRDAATGGGGEAQARAAQAVVSEIASDPKGYAGRMSAPVTDAVADMGGTYMDAFAASPAASSGYVPDRVDSVGRSMGPSFQLTADDSVNFLRYIGSTDDQHATDFQAQAKLYSHADLTAAFRSGDPQAVTGALQTAGRLDGAITQANVESRLGDVADADARAKAAYQASVLAEKADNQLRNVMVVAGRELINEIPGVSSITAVGAEIAKGWNNYDATPPPGPTPELPHATAEITAEANRAQAVNRDVLIAGAMQDAGYFPSGQAPAILTADANHDGHVDPPQTSSVHQDEVLRRVPTVLGERFPNVDADQFDDGRSQVYSVTGQLDGKAPDHSRWSGSDELYYGSPRPEDTPLGNREKDPRVLDDPGYDPLDRAR